MANYLLHLIGNLFNIIILLQLFYVIVWSEEWTGMLTLPIPIRNQPFPFLLGI